jgi:anthranilate synthase component 1
MSPLDAFADLETPVSAYLKLAPLSPRFLLESVEGGRAVGRYSFIGFGEAEEMRFLLEPSGAVPPPRSGGGVGANAVRADGGGQPGGHTEHGETAPPSASRLRRETPPPQAGEEPPDRLLAQLRAALARAPRLTGTNGEAPLTGGLVGYASWDLARRLIGLPASRHDEADALAHYVAPRAVLVFDHLRRDLRLLFDGADNERRDFEREVAAALHRAAPQTAQEASFEPPSPNQPREAFLSSVLEAQERIRAGDVYQLVLSVRFEGACELAPFDVYRALRRLNPSPYMYYGEFGGVAVAGSSPETLAKLTGRRARLRPIAGTRPRGKTEREDAARETSLLKDPKERSEHVMLVDLARNDLGRVASAGSVRVDPFMAVERYSHVMHMVSGVEAELAPDLDAFDVFAASFPAGTLAGAPKRRAMELIDELEPEGRGLYGGAFGYFGAGGDMDHAIAIRTMTFSEGRYAFQAGAGIVIESDPEREYEEVLAKGAVLRAALQTAGGRP